MATLVGDFAWGSSAVNADWVAWQAQAPGGFRLATIATDPEQWYAVGFREPRQIDTIILDQPSATLHATEITVEASTDSLVWTEVHVESGLTNGTNITIDMSAGDVPEANYWRLRATALNDVRIEFEYVRWVEGPGTGTLALPPPTVEYGMGQVNWFADGVVTVTASATDFGGAEFLDQFDDVWRGATGYTVDYDFGCVITPHNLIIKGGHSSNTLEQFTLYYSDNGSDWTEFYAQTSSLSGIYSPPQYWFVLNFEGAGGSNPGSHRYWRVEIDGYGGSGAEIDFMMFLPGTYNGTLDVAQITDWDKSFTPEAVAGSQVAPSPLNDGTTVTYARSPNGTNWWLLDFGEEVTLHTIELYEDGFRTGSSGVFAIPGEPVSDWTDWTEYTQQISHGWAAPGANQYVEHVLEGKGSYRYYAVRNSNKMQWADAVFHIVPAGGGGALVVSGEAHWDALGAALIEAGMTPGEIVAMLNEFNGTVGIGYEEARRTALGLE